MAKAKQPVVADTGVSITSLEDAGFVQAGAHEVADQVAHFVMAKVPSFPDEIPSETKDALYKGYRRKFALIKGTELYAVIGDHLVKASDDQRENPKVEKIEIGVDYAFSYTSQEFGKLRNERPELHKVIGDVREKASTYCSNRLADLKRAVRKIKNAGKERQRVANKNFAEYVDKFFEDSLDRLKSASARGDTTANVDRFNKAKVAFMVAWKHGE
jgi:hypothetical protein